MRVINDSTEIQQKINTVPQLNLLYDHSCPCINNICKKKMVK